MSSLSAKLDWKNQRLTFHSSSASIPAIHRVNRNTCGHVSPPGTASVSVASVHRDCEGLPVSLEPSYYYVPPRSEASVLVGTDSNKPLTDDTDVVLETPILSP